MMNIMRRGLQPNKYGISIGFIS